MFSDPNISEMDKDGEAELSSFPVSVSDEQEWTL